jgi:hypothetical protein
MSIGPEAPTKLTRDDVELLSIGADIVLAELERA